MFDWVLNTPLDVNSNIDFIFFCLTCKDIHMTTPEYLSEFNSFYVDFNEGTS